jgi:predicted porin
VQVKEASIGYDYVLSKRTKMYVAYNKIDNGMNSATTGSTYYYIAGPAGNVGNGTSGSISPGTDVTTFGLGVQHVF